MKTFAWRSMMRGVRSYHCSPTVPRILVTGALGQIGTNLVPVLQERVGVENVIASDLTIQSKSSFKGRYKYLNVMNINEFHRAIVDDCVDFIFHLPSIMSVLGEAHPTQALSLNVDGTRNALEVASKHKCRIFVPSTMGVYGKDCGKVKTVEDTVLNPTTVYGVTKIFSEGLGKWYHSTRGLDFRSIRIGGVISPETLPGGGTTDYAVHMIHSAMVGETLLCPVLPDEPLPMIYIDDCISGFVDFMFARNENLKRRVYNIQGITFTPAMLQSAIKRALGTCDVKYQRGLAQDIAHSWPDSLDDTHARNDWNWEPKFDLDAMVKAMIRDSPKFHKKLCKG